MIVTATGARVVSKSKQVWRDGDVSYRVMLTCADGTNPVVVNVETKHDWEQLVEMDVVYDMDICVETNGYKHYLTLKSADEQ